MNILIVEDNPSDLQIIKRNVERSDESTLISDAQNLSQAQNLLSERGADLILLDLNLPDSRGIDTFFHLSSRHSEIPVIILSGLEDEETAKSALENGAQDYIVKDDLLTTRELNRSIKFALDRKRAVESLSRHENHLKNVINCSGDGIITYDLSLNINQWNPAMEQFFEIPEDEVIGKRLVNIPFFQKEPGIEDFFKSAFTGVSTPGIEKEHTNSNGKKHFFEISNFPLRDSSDELYGGIAIFRDVSYRRSIERMLHSERAKALVTLQALAEAVVTTDPEGKLDFMNTMAEQLSGFESKEGLGKHFEEVFDVRCDVKPDSKSSPVRLALSEGRHVKLGDDYTLFSKDGREYSIEISSTPLRDNEEKIIGTVTVVHDISRARKLHKQMIHQVNHDYLTGLLNRKSLEARLKVVVETAKNAEYDSVLLYLDLDMFKLVNDSGGHIAGDTLLKESSSILKQMLPDDVNIARIGGDEFCVIIEDIDLKKGKKLAEMIRKRFADYKFSWYGEEFPVRVSIGITAINKYSQSETAVFANADDACYYAKSKGGNRVHSYTANDESVSNRRVEMQWINRIASAFDEDRFILYKQKIASVDEREDDYEHYEILIRMVDKEGNVISPARFIPAAERYSLMPAIDRWVIDKTFFMFEKLYILDEEKKPPMYSINLSGASLGDDNFLDFIFEKFVSYDVPTENISFEITETAAIENINHAVDFIRQLKEQGCRFSLDDFGSGLSSFHYLKSLPVDYLKIDGSFIKDMLDDPRNFAMVHSMNHIGHIMGMRTIAEFVENESILKKIREIGIDYAQGYGISRPQPFN